VHSLFIHSYRCDPTLDSSLRAQRSSRPHRLTTDIIVRLETGLQSNIGFTLRRVLVVFKSRVPSKVNRFRWNLELSEYIFGGLALADFGRDPRTARSSDSWRARQIFIIRLNFTKFEHNTSISVAMKTFRTEFYRMQSFFQKMQKISPKFLTSCDFRHP